MTADRTETVTQTAVNEPGVNRAQATTTEVTENKVSGARLVARIIRFVTATILTLLLLRFVLVLFGANQSSGFVEFILDVTAPLVAPFEGIFGNPADTVRFEPQTLTAMVVYGLVGAALAYLARIKQPRTN